jgi:hypothetical protein
VAQSRRRAGGVQHPTVAQVWWGRRRVGGALAAWVVWAGQNMGGGGLTGGPPECVGPSHSGRGAGVR